MIEHPEPDDQFRSGPDPYDRPGRRLIMGAWMFHQAALLLDMNTDTARSWTVSFVNLCFAIELGLKAFLRESGMSENDQRSLSHRIVDALNKAKELGFVPGHPAEEEIVWQLAPHHEDMSLRYLEGLGVELPNMKAAVAAVGSLLSSLYQQCSFGEPEPSGVVNSETKKGPHAGA